MKVARGEVEPVEPTSLALVKGREYEQEYVARRRQEVAETGGRFVDITEEAPNDVRAQRELLAQAMADGIELIAQAPLQFQSIFGYADLLERVEKPASGEGDEASEEAGDRGAENRGAGESGGGKSGSRAYYEPVEIKYARSVRPSYVLQVCAYARALGAGGGEPPSYVHIVTGDGQRHSFVTSEYVEYFDAALERFTTALTTDLDQSLDIVPEPVSHCADCDFRSTCDTARRSADHLSLVARIRADQRTKLRACGVETLTDLATFTDDHVPGIGRQTLPQLVAQARLQLDAKSASSPPVEYRLPAEDEVPGRGFAMVPDPDPQDMFFDFEGYPYHESGALEYLWGWTSSGPDGAPRFDYLWADDPHAEGLALTSFLDEVHARREASSGMHVFHYAPYEITALRRLVNIHRHESERLDALLRAGVFVDLYATVRQSMLIGIESYSIKKLEPLYGISREGDDLADGGASIDVYEQWLSQGEAQVRDTIIQYNRVDCDSTLALRDWLLDHKSKAKERGVEWPQSPADAHNNSADDDDDDPPEPHPSRLVVDRLNAVASNENLGDDTRRAATILAALPGWQRRIDREFYGELYGFQHSREPEDWKNQSNALAPLTLISTEDIGRGSICRTYKFPPQISLVDAKQQALDPLRVATCGEVVEVDQDADTVTIKTIKSVQAKLDANDHRAGRALGALPNAIVGHTKAPTLLLEAVALNVGEHFLNAVAAGRDPFDPLEPFSSTLTMLSRKAPRITAGSELLGSRAAQSPEELVELTARLDSSYYIIQGPPGTGKTWTGARIIAGLVAKGMKVGISSNSHSAILNMLRGLDDYRAQILASDPARKPTFSAAYHKKRGAKGTPDDGTPSIGFGEDWITISSSTSQAAKALAEGDVQILAGTAWQMAKARDIDVMIVDEAGQVSLLHAVAMTACARRTVLIGDPQQLAQPSTVNHPAGCSASILEHIFDGSATVPEGFGVLLPESRRMHESIAQFIGTTYYEGRLHAHPDTKEHLVRVPGRDDLSGTGIRLIDVPHTDNRVQSEQEAEAIRATIEVLLDSGRVVARSGAPERALTARDILVVAPYNAQRRLLERVLPDGITVGTVDKFQGQEAPIAIVSMTASSSDELPRGLEFLLDPHRLNVAISRARALAIVVASPSLLATAAGSLKEMRLLNDVARLRRVASTVRSAI